MLRIINLDKKEWLTPERFGEEPTLEALDESNDGVLTALAILLADGNGRGGGDLHSHHPIIGTWAGDHLVVAEHDAVLPQFAEPGLANVPLFTQVQDLGRDVSDLALAAIVDGEGDYTVLGGLDLAYPDRRAQRQLFRDALPLLRPDCRTVQGVANVEQFVQLLGGELKESAIRTAASLTTGINALCTYFGAPTGWSVVRLYWRCGTLEVDNGSSRGSRPDCVGVRLELTGPGGWQEQEFRFGPDGVTPATLLAVFGIRLSTVATARVPYSAVLTEGA